MEEPTESLLAEAGNSNETTQWYSDNYKEVVEKKGWKTGDDALKSYTELEKSMGARVKMPTPESSAEEIRAFYQKTGCPENPDGYEIKVSEEIPAFLRNEDIENDLKKIAHAEGISKQGFETIVSKFYERQNEMVQHSRQQGEAKLKEEWSTKYPEELEIAKRFCNECSDEFKQLLEQSGLGNNPLFIKEFNRLGKKTMSDSLIRGSQGDNEPAYEPKYKSSPAMYATGEDEESKKAREYFKARGFKY